MLQTSFTKVKINEIVQGQIPDYIDAENPLFGEFLKQYYLSEEFQGGALDIADNLVEYKSLDFLNKENLTGFTSISSYINAFDDTVHVDSTTGWPSQWGLLKVDDEIITYTGLTTNTFTGCVRGFSGIEKNSKTNEPEYLTFTQSGIGTHRVDAKVENLSNVFLKTFLKKLKTQVLPGFSERNINTQVDQSNFIRQAKDFYSSKGTEESFKILFSALYNEKVDMIQPSKYLIKPSGADYIVNDVLICEALEGDPEKIEGQSLIQDTQPLQTSGSIFNVERAIIDGKKFYKIGIDQSSIVGKFRQIGKTFITKTSGIGATILHVDSTVGFGSTGTIKFEDRTFDYGSKNITQFVGVSTLTSPCGIGSTVRSGLEAFSYEDGDLSKIVRLNVLGVISKFVGDATNQQNNSNINVKSLGIVQKDLRWSSWIYNTAATHNLVGFKDLGGNSYRFDLINDHVFYVGDKLDVVDEENNIQEGTVLSTPNSKSVVASTGNLDPSITYYIRRRVKVTSDGYTADIQNSYSSDETVYVASNSLPHWDIDPQDRKRTFNSSLNSAGSTIEIIDHNFHDGELVVYTCLSTKLTNLNNNQPYYIKKIDNNRVALAYSLENVRNSELITAFTAEDIAAITTHFLTPDVVFGSSIGAQKILRKFDEPVFAEDKSKTVQGGVGLFANGVEIYSYKATDKVFYGPLESVEILNSGSGYDVISPPRLSVTQTGHTGVGASAITHVEGELEEIVVDTEGLDYLDTPNVSITGGNDTSAIARAQMKLVHQEVEFDSTTQGSIVNTTTDRFVFPEPHGFKHGEELLYYTSGSAPIGIGTTPGTLENQSSYFVVKLDDFEMHISETKESALSGIGTIDLTTNGGGVHRFSAVDRRTKIDKILLDNPGKFKNRQNTTSGVTGINTFTSTFTITDHNFLSGDIVRYTADNNIGGLTSGSDYYAIKIDSNTFRLSSKKDLSDVIELTSMGSGTHTFQDPPIEVTISGRQGITTANAVGTPIARGKVIGLHIENPGTDFGSTVINDNFKPDIRIVEGENSFLQAFVLNGRIDQIIILSGGEQFFSTPDIIITGDGVGAKAKAVIENGSIVRIDMITKGMNYTQGQTRVKALTPGSGAIFFGNVKEWTVNQVERLAKYGDVKTDDGFLEIERDSKLGNPYVNYYVPRNIRSYLGDDGSEHSPILGWAYDGHPIYGPNAIVGGQLKNIESSYSLFSGVDRLDGPPLSKYPAGFFIEDYTFVEGYGDLDEHNGRFAVTPDFPNGVYAYYTTVENSDTLNPLDPFDNTRRPVFPYVVGDTYNSTPIEFNIANDSVQDIDINELNLIRNTDPHNINEYQFVTNSNKNTTTNSKILSIKSDSLDKVEVIDSGREFNVNDALTFDNKNTKGFGAIGKVTKVTGPTLSTITSTITDFEDVIFSSTNNLVTGITTLPHGLANNTYARVLGISTTTHSAFEDTPRITVESVRSSLSEAMLSIGLTTQVSFSDGFGANKFTVNDIVRIDSEQLKVYGYDSFFNQYKLFRAQNGTVAAAHTYGTPIERMERKFTYPITKKFYDSTEEDFSTFFDATSVVGVGLTFGVGIGVTISVNDVDKFIPTRSIFIENHSFNHGEKLSYNPGAGTSLTYQTDAMKRVSTGFKRPLPPEVFVQTLDNNLIGIVTTRTGIGSDLDRVMFDTTTGIGNTHNFTTTRNTVTGTLRIIDVQATTVGVHSMRPTNSLEMTLVSAARSTVTATYDPGTRFVSIGSSVNPPLRLTIGDTLIVNTDDGSMLDTKMKFFLDRNYKKPFVGSGVSTIEVTEQSIPGNVGGMTSITFTPEVPSILYYQFVPVGTGANAKVIEIDKDIDNYSKIIVDASKFTGNHSITTTGSNTYNFNIVHTPEKVGYSTSSTIETVTNSATHRGGVEEVILTANGIGYKDLPEVSIASTTGTGASLKVVADNIGRLENVEIIDFGYDYPSDTTLRPEAEVSQIISLKDNFSVTSVGITSVGSKYLTPPNFVVYNRKKNIVSGETEFLAELNGGGVGKVTIVNGGGNLSSSDNELIAVDNTNGVGIITATYSDPNVTLRLQTPSGGFTTSLPMPFQIGDRVFVENIGVSSGLGYNSANHNYEFFTLTGVTTAFGLVDEATITYAVNNDPGFHDFEKFGTVSNEKDIAKFKLNLSEGVFNNNERVFTPLGAQARIIAGDGKTRNTLRVDNLVGFSTGDKLTGELSRASGTIESLKSFKGHFDIDSSIPKRFGWEDDSGKLSDFYQRVQDNDYYQNFSYSLKSQVGISSWSEPVDSLAHITGFKKHSDLLIPSIATGAGSSIVGLSSQAGGVMLLDAEVDLDCRDQFDLVSENTNSDATSSSEVNFNSKRFGEAIACKGNRVLDIDDISPQFYSDADIFRSIELDRFDMTSVSAIKYYAQVVLDTSLGITFNATQYTEFIVSHDGSVAFLNTYSELSDAFDLGEFTATASGSICSVSFTPSNTTYEYDITFHKEVLGSSVGVGTTAVGMIQKVGMTSAIASSGSPAVNTVYEFSGSEFRSGSIIVAAGTATEKEIDEFSFLASGTNDCSYSNFGLMDAGTDMGSFVVNQASGVIRLEFTPAANTAVTVSTLSTVVGVATTVASSGFTTTQYRIGDTELNSRRTTITSAASPTATVIAGFSSANYTSVRYTVEVENTTDNAYSSYNIVANSYEGNINFVKFNNLSTASGISTIGADTSIPGVVRDVRATEVVASGTNTELKFTPAPNKAYIVRVAQLRIDKPDDLSSDLTVGF